MSEHWGPNSRVSITNLGVVIEIEFGGVDRPTFWFTVEGSELCLHWIGDDLVTGESRFHVPPGYSIASAKAKFAAGVLRIEIHPGAESVLTKPLSMLILCRECGKHFDIVVSRKGSESHRCPFCGNAQPFDLSALVAKAIEQGTKMIKTSRRRRF